MKNLIPLLKRSKLFSGVGEDGIVSMLNCLNATSLHFKKGDYIFRQGEYLHSITLLTEGRLLGEPQYLKRNRSWRNVRRSLHRTEQRRDAQ